MQSYSNESSDEEMSSSDSSRGAKSFIGHRFSKSSQEGNKCSQNESRISEKREKKLFKSTTTETFP